MKTTKLFLVAFTAVAVFIAGCKKYDDTDLRNKVDDHEARITDLEDVTEQLQAQIASGALISSITEIVDENEMSLGWHIEFTGGSTPSIDLFHGEAGQAADPTDSMPVIEVRDNGDGTTTIWVDYGDGFVNTGEQIAGPQGEIGPEGPVGPVGPQGIPGVNAVNPIFEVRPSEGGGSTVWYNATVGYPDGDFPDGGWVDTEWDITGAPGVDAVTPIFKVDTDEESGESFVLYNVTLADEDPETDDDIDGDGYADTGWEPTGANITGATGAAGNDAVTPKFKVVDGILQYNVTLAEGAEADGDGYALDGWVSTGVSLIGAKGEKGDPGVTPKFRVVDGILQYNVTLLDNGEYDDVNGWVSTGADLTGAPGLNGVSPIIKVDTEDDGKTWYIYYNVTSGYPESGWVKTDEDISSIGYVRSIVNNPDGTVTITTKDGTEFDFERASTAARFEIMSYDAVSVPEGGTGYVRFVVNPSTATIPTTSDDVDNKWYLNALGTRAPGYVNASAAFRIAGISPGSGEGEYVAAIQRKGAYAEGEHMVALVLDTGTEADPVLVSSSFFSLVMAVTPPDPSVITITDQPDDVEVTEWNIPEGTKLSVMATATENAFLSYQWYRNETASNEGGTAIGGATGASYTIPTNTAAGTYYYFVEVSATGGATPVRSAAATVTVTADREHQDLGVVIGGLTWATRNVGARGTFVNAPTDYGNYYDFDDAQNACPTGWRLPTRAELASIADESVWSDGGEVNGRRFGPTNGQQMFMPAAGFDSWISIGVIQDGSTGSYWSSTTDNGGIFGAKRYFGMSFTYAGVNTEDPNESSTENTVRCVKVQ